MPTAPHAPLPSLTPPMRILRTPNKVPISRYRPPNQNYAPQMNLNYRKYEEIWEMKIKKNFAKSLRIFYGLREAPSPAH